MIHSSTQNLYLQTSIEVVPQGWKRLYGIAFVATLIALSANLLDVILGFGETNMTAYGTMSAVAWFTLFEEDWFKGLYTLGLLNMVYTISMLPVFFAIAAAHRHTKWVYAALTVTLFFIGAAVYLSNNAAIPMFVLSQRYAVAGTDVEKAMFAAAGEAVLVSGEDFTPGSFIGEFRPLLLNSDDPLTTYHPDQRKIALENPQIVAAPGLYFNYNKYHPQLLGMILERTTGMSPTAYLQTRLWDKLGMEYGGSWSVDSVSSDFEKMETGVNARAVDFAKLGQFFLDKGQWQGQQILSSTWVAEATQPWKPDAPATYYPAAFAAGPGERYYGFMWWGFGRPGGDYDYSAAGDKGQYIYVSPAKRLVIVRHGIDYGIPSSEWLKLFYEFASRY